MCFTFFSTRAPWAGAKETVAWADVATRVPELLEIIQADMFAAAKARTATCTEVCHSWEDFTTALNNKHMALTPWWVYGWMYGWGSVLTGW